MPGIRNAKPLAGGLILLGLTLLAYLPAIGAGYIWDDDDYITGNEALRTPGGLARIWTDLEATPQYYPLVHTTYWIEYRLWQLRPAGYHLVNILLHALAAALAWRVLRRIGIAAGVSWMAAAVFALHPVHVESVAWVTERKNTLSGVFYMASLLAYLRYLGWDSDGADARDQNARMLDDGRAPRIRRILYGISLAMFTAALLSKTVTATLPAAILILIWNRRGRISAADVKSLLPFFLVGAGFGLMTAWFERSRIGATGPDWDFSFIERCLIASRALWFYAAKLLCPFGLTFIYPRWEIDAGQALQYVFPLLALALPTVLWSLRSRIGRGPLAAAIFFAATLGPALGFLNVYPMLFSFVADHFQYLASLGVIVALTCSGAWAVRAVATKFEIQTNSANRAVGTSVLLALGILTFSQARTYHDADTLWRETLRRNPGAWMAHNNLGDLQFDQGRFEASAESFKEVIRLKPDYTRAHENLGVAYSKLGRSAEAYSAFGRAAQLEPTRAAIHNSLGIEAGRLGRLEDSVRHFRDGAKADPDLLAARENLGMALLGLGRIDQAEEVFADLRERAPDSAIAWQGLGRVHYRRGRFKDAEVSLREATRLDPNDPEHRNDLALTLLALGRRGEAVALLQAVLDEHPNHGSAIRNLQRAKQGAQATRP